MCEFRGCMCTSFQHMRTHESQVFQGDFRRVLKLQSAFHCWVIFMANFVEPRGKKWKTGGVQIKPEWMNVCMRGIWAGLCIFKNPVPAGLKDQRTSFVTRGCNYSAVGSGVQRDPVWHDNRAVPVFPDNNIGEAWKPVKIRRDKPQAARILSMKRNWPFAFWSHRIPTNAVSSSVWQPCHHGPRLQRQYMKSKEGAVLEVRASLPPEPQNTGSSHPIFSWRLTFFPGSQSSERAP